MSKYHNDEFSLIARASVVENGGHSGSKRPDGYEGPYESTGMESKDFQLALGYTKGNYSSDFRINFNESILYSHMEMKKATMTMMMGIMMMMMRMMMMITTMIMRHEEEESYQDIENFIVSWKNDVKFDNSVYQ